MSSAHAATSRRGAPPETALEGSGIVLAARAARASDTRDAIANGRCMTCFIILEGKKNVRDAEGTKDWVPSMTHAIQISASLARCSSLSAIILLATHTPSTPAVIINAISKRSCRRGALLNRGPPAFPSLPPNFNMALLALAVASAALVAAATAAPAGVKRRYSV